LPNHLRVWSQQPEQQDFSNHGDSLFDYQSDYPSATPGDSLSRTTEPNVWTTEPVQEVNRVSSP